MTHYQTLNHANQMELTDLFTSVFTSAEGEEEGRLVGHLASELALGIDQDEIICFGAYQDDLLIAAIFFTRLDFRVPVSVYMLAPVAVRTQYQRKGIGQALIYYGLNELKQRSVSVVVTYGDPAFYQKIDFKPLSEKVIQAPLALSMPIGWLGQSLVEAAIPTFHQRPICVKAFNDPVYW